ncbi:cytochrome-c peroxidase [Aquabacterium sp. OR-4]|uniref:cytochrome-c peroxidase n=1 Tax=Aquabacterium sp. OR-4 TaxID=2978127 RepID=UPI0021B1C3A9|nr:cytochrome c peroxidase [Aquabacterium sp. OR-4]MDT7833995.1 cytochrome c peroxidase [Aquabacterium sp. OR-4]
MSSERRPVPWPAAWRAAWLAASLVCCLAAAAPPARAADAAAPQALAGDVADCLQRLAQPGAERQHPQCLQQAYQGASAHWPAAAVDAGVRWQELAPRRVLPPQPPALVALGEQLFFERGLSRQRDLSCASCHAPHLGFADGRRVAVGHEAAAGLRHTPHLMGVGHVPAGALMWDGRARDLERQALLPLTHPQEMAMDLPTLLQRLGRDAVYAGRFAAVFGDEAVTIERLGQALASYQRTLQAPRSRFDEFIEGRRETFSPQELRGLHLFRTRARCMNCHSGPELTQHEFHQIGISFLGRPREDRGRQAITGRADDLGSFRTPSLRGVGRTAPYMHQGILTTLRQVLDLYNQGMVAPPQRDPPLPGPSPLIKPLQLTRPELDDIEAFLRTL